MDVVVAGAGVAGLAAALCFGRSGHNVTLLERDSFEFVERPERAFLWKRKGIAHFQQPHAFLPRGRRELMVLFPDVYQALLHAGASDYPIAEKIQGKPETSDQDLVYLFVRRPVIEWALRRAVFHEPSVQVRGETRVSDLLLDQGDIPTVCGVLTAGGEKIHADFVVDAQGRTTSFPSKLAVAGPRLTTENSHSHIVYYSRYFQMLPGKQFPRGPWLATPRGDLGYAGYSSFTGDNGTFALVLAVGSWDHEFRILQHESAWDAAAREIPILAPLIDPQFAFPITRVLAMGELQNTLRHYVENGRPRVRGVMGIGDTICHTDPSFALGLSFALIHVRALSAAIEECQSNFDSISLAFWNAVYPEMRERYDLAVATDDARAQMWQGKPLDFYHARGSYPLFSMLSAALAALQDDEVLRKTVRRIGFLDRLSIFDEDFGLHRKIEQIVADRLRSNPPRPPLREELLRRACTALGPGAIEKLGSGAEAG